jgi:hypothetical protein
MGIPGALVVHKQRFGQCLEPTSVQVPGTTSTNPAFSGPARATASARIVDCSTSITAGLQLLPAVVTARVSSGFVTVTSDGLALGDGLGDNSGLDDGLGDTSGLGDGLGLRSGDTEGDGDTSSDGDGDGDTSGDGDGDGDGVSGITVTSRSSLKMLAAACNTARGKQLLCSEP